MGTKDRDSNATKGIDGQFDFSGGMDWVTDSAKLSDTNIRLLTNMDVRSGNAEKAKGQKPFVDIEIGAMYHDKFTATTLDPTKWFSTSVSGGSITTNNEQLNLTGPSSGNAWDTVGVVSLRATELATLSYFEFDITTPATLTSLTRFRIGLSASKTALGTDSGLQIEFDESGDIIRREDTSETDTTINWAVATTYRIRIEKKDTGWKAFMLNLTTAPHTEITLFDTSFTGNATNFVELQVFGGLWLVDRTVYHIGFGSGGARKSPNGLYRFYRETAPSETIVIANGNMYKFDTADGYTLLASGFEEVAKYKFEVFNDTLFMVDGVNIPRRYNGLNVQQVGSGATIAPAAQDVHNHLQSLFMLKDNSLFRNTVGQVLVWDALQPVVDLDAWKGDIGVGLVKLGSNLYIIKSASVWELTGTTNDNFRLRRIPNTRGCIAPHSIATNGQVAFWRGIDGVYRFDGTNTVLISFAVNPAFDNQSRSEYPTTVESLAENSVGIIHNYKYRLACSQHGEADLEINNFEWVYDMLASGGRGAWMQRSDRNVSMYAALDGKGDSNQLLYVSSDTRNDLYEGEIDNGNIYNTYTNISDTDKFDTDFVGRIVGKRHVALSQARTFLDKYWNGHWVHYEGRGDFTLGMRVFTKYNSQGSLSTFKTQSTTNTNTMNGSNMKMDGTQALINGFVEEKTIPLKFPASESKNQGSEMWWEITQDASVRTSAGVSGTGLLANPGNFEPFSIKKVVLQFTEGNH